MRPATPHHLVTRAQHVYAAGNVAEAEALCARADHATPTCHQWAHRRQNEALAYAAAGQPVFPLQEGSKLPLPGSKGFKDATCDPGQVAAWWPAGTARNIGLATGHRFDVIDLDSREAWDVWHALDDTPTPAGVAVTPRGWHLYVPASGHGNRAGMLPGVDYRGTGGYVLAPPSYLVPTDTHPGGRYWWHTNPYTQEPPA